jgi:hypothetical protein
MPFAFSQIDPRTTGEVSNPVIPLNRYLGAVWDEGVDSSVFQSVSKLEEFRLAHEGAMINPEEANAKYGLPGLTFDSSTYEEVARLKRDRRQAELDRQYYLQHGSDGLFSGRGAAQLGIGFLASISNPLDAALMFMPVVGSEARAAKLAEMGVGPARQALARGLISTEVLTKTFPRTHGFVESATQAMTQQALMEIPVAFSKISGGQEYTPQTFLQDVVGAGALSTILHAGFKALGRMHDATKEAVLKKAMADFIEGKPIDVKGLVNIDENVIRQRAMFDETAARERASLNINEDAIKQAVFEKYGETVKAAALRITHTDGSVEVKTGDAHALIFMENQLIDKPDAQLEDGFVTDKGRFITRQEAATLAGFKGEAVGNKWRLDSLVAEDLRSAPEDQVNEVMAQGYSREDANKIVLNLQKASAKEAFFSRPDIQKVLAQRREAAIQDYVDKLKQEHDPEAAFKRQLEEEVASQLRDGKVLSEEHAKKYGFETVEKAVPAVTEDVNEMLKSLQDELKQLDEDVKNLKSPNAEILLKALDKLKVQINPGDLHAFGLIPEAWNFFVETLKALVKVGDAVAQAAKPKAEKKGMNRRKFLDIMGKAIAATHVTLPVPIKLLKSVHEPFSIASFTKAMEKVELYREDLRGLIDEYDGDPIIEKIARHFENTSGQALSAGANLTKKLHPESDIPSNYGWPDRDIDISHQLLSSHKDATAEDLLKLHENLTFDDLNSMITMANRLEEYIATSPTIETILKAPELNKAEAKKQAAQEEAKRQDAISQALALTKEKYPDLKPDETRIREVISGDRVFKSDDVTKAQLEQVKELRSLDDAIKAAVGCMRNKLL